MKGDWVSIEVQTEEGAAHMTAQNKYGYVYPHGLFVILDSEMCIIESRDEAEKLIADIAEATDRLWPK